MAKIKRLAILSAAEDVKQWELACCWWECKLDPPPWSAIWNYPRESDKCTRYDSVLQLSSGPHTQEMQVHFMYTKRHVWQRQ